MSNSREIVKEKIYNLEDRSFEYAKSVCLACKKIKFSTTNIEYIKQVIRSSASIGANYIEANECLGEKDFLLRIKISRKEAKETVYWLKLIKETNEQNIKELVEPLINEGEELKKILSAIFEKRKKTISVNN